MKVYDGERYRNLTPKEYFRLMGFTDADVELLELNGISKTQLCKMAGNSIPVKCWNTCSDKFICVIRPLLSR